MGGKLLVLLVLLFSVWSGCGQSGSVSPTTKPSEDHGQSPITADAVKGAQQLIAQDTGDPQAACLECSAYHFDAPREHTWRVTGKVDIHYEGPNKPVTERPFSTELFWDGSRFQRVWLAIGRQAMERHEK
jgi:hypothetical protein